jgi:hypothetical protein
MRAVIGTCLALLGCLTPALARPSECQPTRVGGTYSLELIGGDGRALPTFDQDGQTYVMGQLGERYTLRLRNHSGRRVEFVASVDGRDVLDGQPSDLEKRGYIVNPYGEVTIDGFRLNTDSVAAFRFSNVSHSYASRMGDARDVGVIGVGVFTERYVPPPPVHYHQGYYDLDGRLGGSAAKGELNGLGSAAADMAPAGPPAPEASRGAERRKSARAGLGTEFGEQRESHVYETEFERASSRPAVVLNLRYDDRQGLQAMGVNVDHCCGTDRYDLGLRETAQPFRRDGNFAQPPPGWEN